MLKTKSAQNLIFEVTPVCSLNCKHCYNIQKISNQYPSVLLNTEKTCELLKTAISKIGCKKLILTGGELYTRPDVNEILLTADMNPDLTGDTRNKTAVSHEKVASLLAPC